KLIMTEIEPPKQTTVLDSEQKPIGEVYAASLLAATQQAGCTADVLEEFESFISDVLNKLPQLDALLSSPRVAHSDKVVMLDKTLAGKASDLFLNFLKVVSQHGRLDCLRVIQTSLKEQYSKDQGRLEVLVTTATRLDEPAVATLQDKLNGAFDATVDITLNIDSSLVGGTVIRIGDTVYDGSIANRLERIRTTVRENTIREIRLSTERFVKSSSEG
ncbi:MAG: ATP synthase F1 subunit delta, partial [Pirellulaceae bacterium]|nr:ATP synthase F1 subunit delta [Pirellulaceae bacterium]